MTLAAPARARVGSAPGHRAQNAAVVRAAAECAKGPAFERFHPACAGDGPDRAHRRMGAARSLSAVPRLASRGNRAAVPRGQSLRAAVQAEGLCREASDDLPPMDERLGCGADDPKPVPVETDGLGGGALKSKDRHIAASRNFTAAIQCLAPRHSKLLSKITIEIFSTFIACYEYYVFAGYTDDRRSRRRLFLGRSRIAFNGGTYARDETFGRDT